MKTERSTHRRHVAAASTPVVLPRDPGDGYVAIMEGQLALWGSRIDRLDVRARETAGDGDTALRQRAEASRAMRKDLSRRLQELRSARPEHVGSLRAGLALAWRQFTAQVGGHGQGSPAERP
jgi:hypothetical protein